MAVNTSATVRRTRTGTPSSPRPGNSMTMVPMRAKTSMKAAASAGRKEMSSRIAVGSTAHDDAGREPGHVTLQRIRHERQRDQHGEEDRQDLRYEDQSHFLDLGERLKQRDHHADNQSD